MVAQTAGLRDGQLNDFFTPGGQPLGGKPTGGADPHQPGNGGLYALRFQPGLLQNLGGYSLAFLQKTQKQMLAAHIAVAQLGGGLLGQTQSCLGPMCKLTIHAARRLFQFGRTL